MLFSLILILPIMAKSQVTTSNDYELELSKPYPVVDAVKKWYFTHEDKMLTIKMGRDFVIQQFDTEKLLEIDKHTIVTKTDLPRGFVHEEFLQNKNRIFQFYNVWDKPNKTEQIYVKEFDINSIKKFSEPKLVLKNEGHLKSEMGSNKIDLYQSFDKSKTLMVYEDDEGKIDFRKIGLVVLDSEMNELWRTMTTLKYPRKEIDRLSYTLDNNGNAYMSVKRKSKDELFPVDLLKLNKSGANELKIDAGGKFFREGFTLREAKDGKLICAGYYGGRVAIQGLYISFLTPEGTFENEQFHEIPLDIINQYKNDRQQEKAKKVESEGGDVGIDHLRLDDIIIENDGSVTTIGEVFWVFTMPGADKSTNSYFYKEIFVTKLSQTGELVYMKKLIKNQFRSQSFNGKFGMSIAAAFRAATKEPLYDLSYKYIRAGEFHYFIFLDHIDNLNLAENERPKQHRSGLGGYLTSYRVNDKTGETEKLSLFDLRNLKGMPVYQYNTGRVVEKNSNEMLVEFYMKKKQDALVKIKIK